MTAGRRQRGTTLVELLVSLALLSVIAVVTAGLVIQATRLMDTAARASHNPTLTLAGEWLRRDLYETTTVIGGAGGWIDGPLVTLPQHGGWVTYAMVDGELVRTNAPPSGPAADTRVLLHGVVGWRWRLDGGISVRIEIEALANPEAHRNLTGVRFTEPVRQTERMTIALRGRPGGRAW